MPLVRTLKFFLHSPHQYGIGFPDGTLLTPELEHFGQCKRSKFVSHLFSSNHFSAVSSSGNISNNPISEISFLYAFPGALFLLYSKHKSRIFGLCSAGHSHIIPLSVQSCIYWILHSQVYKSPKKGTGDDLFLSWISSRHGLLVFPTSGQYFNEIRSKILRQFDAWLFGLVCVTF